MEHERQYLRLLIEQEIFVRSEDRTYNWLER